LRRQPGLKGALECSLEDPVVNDAAGSFANTTLAGLYLDLIASGEVSLLDALFVGALIGEVDMRDIQEAIDETVQEDRNDNH
jgi:hypothetical protein